MSDERMFTVTLMGTEVQVLFRRTDKGWVNVDPIEFTGLPTLPPEQIWSDLDE